MKRVFKAMTPQKWKKVSNIFGFLVLLIFFVINPITVISLPNEIYDLWNVGDILTGAVELFLILHVGVLLLFWRCPYCRKQLNYPFKTMYCHNCKEEIK